MLQLVIFLLLALRPGPVRQPVKPKLQIACILISRDDQGWIYIKEIIDKNYFSDTCELYKTIMPYIQKTCEAAANIKEPKKPGKMKI